MNWKIHKRLIEAFSDLNWIREKIETLELNLNIEQL